MSDNWRQLPERSTTSALRTIIWIGLRIGRPVGRVLLYPITAYYALTIAPAVRRASRDYLRRVLPGPVRWWHVVRHLHRYACAIFDRVFFLAGRTRQFKLHIHGGELITEHVDAGRGCLLLSAHLGSFEALRAAGAGKDIRMKVLMDVDHNARITTLFNALNPDMAATIIPLGAPDSLLKVQESLQQGYLVGVLADRIFNDNDRVVSCRFLDGDARFPAGPMLLAAALRCPVLLGFGLCADGDARYDIYFEAFADPVDIGRDRARRLDAARAWSQRYAERLEHYARAAPYNWFNFYDYWQTDAGDRPR